MLGPSSRIAVVAPAGIFDPGRLSKGMDLVRSWGHQLLEGPNLHGRHRYTAGTLEARLTDLNWALTAPDIDAVWFARGGSGTAHLLDGIRWSRLDARPVLGFSDATALFCAMLAKGQGRPVHAPVLHSIADLCDAESQAACRSLLEGTAVHLAAKPHPSSGGGGAPIQAPVVGGNLCVMASLAGTPWALCAHGCIVVIEDVGEAPYRVDRLLHQLLASGALDGAAAVVMGEFRGCAAPEGAEWGLEDVVADLLAARGIPLWTGLPVGHGSQNHAWPVGAPATLDVGGLRFR
jgi:muramoyltetrapeptide carboxypeptidase